MTHYGSDNPNGFVTGKRFSVDEPCVTVMAAGMGGDSMGHWHLHEVGDMDAELRVIHDTGGEKETRWVKDEDVTDRPRPTITSGAGGMNSNHFHVESRERRGRRDKNGADKPPYRVPSMDEIRAVEKNGLKVASTFSGCGGSCLGYRMAGFNVVWANEFVPAAQDSYEANKEPGSILDKRDVRTIEPAEILVATGLKEGDLDVLDGSPPCQAFSTAGKRHKGWGQKKQYEHGAEQYNETLFDEYVRLLRGLRPRAFVAENVSGLAKGVAKGMFLEILAGLKASGYDVECRLLDAQWLGVPQVRRRVIFVGVRKDLGKRPRFPKPLPYRYSVRDAIPWISEVRQNVYGGTDQRRSGNGPYPTVHTNGVGAARGKHHWCEVVHELGGLATTECADRPAPATAATQYRMTVETFRTATRDDERWVSADRPYTTVGTSPQFGNNLNNTGGQIEMSGGQKRKFTIAELRRICGFPDDFVLTGSYAQQWERLGNSVPPVMMEKIAAAVRDVLLDG